MSHAIADTLFSFFNVEKYGAFSEPQKKKTEMGHFLAVVWRGVTVIEDDLPEAVFSIRFKKREDKK